MTTRPRHSLPLLGGGLPAGPRRLEQARRELGGRASTDSSAGALVVLTTAERVVNGVVLYGSATEVDVWLGDGRVRRTRPERISPHRGVADEGLVCVAADARVFASLVEGQAVNYLDERGAPQPGTLVEKCRYGGLVARDDGAIVAVGFRRLAPVASRADEPS